MNSTPLVTIIINNYNYGHFLREAIESALAQTYTEKQVIVVDDGSTDNSREIIAGYGGQVLPVLKENGGQASAFNAGFAHSQGDIVIFLDADDRLVPTTAKLVSDAFLAHVDVAKVEYRMEIIDSESRPTGEIKPPLHLPLRSGDLRPYVLKFPYDLTWMATSGNAFCAKVLKEIFPVPEQEYGRVGADWYLSHLTPLFGPVVFLEDIGAFYRVHRGNNYDASLLNLEWTRQSIHYMNLTSRFIIKIADRLELPGRPAKASDLLSVSYLTNRMTSYKLERAAHPLKEDRLGQIYIEGVRASLGRSDISWPMKLMFIGWFSAMLVAPRWVAFTLAEKFFFPQKRKLFNRLLGFLHK